jgi:hypothetical protein
MRRALIVAAAILLNVGDAYSACLDGSGSACVIDGRPGERWCAGGRISPCIANEPPAPRPPPPERRTVEPNYVVLTVVYAPPGTKGGRSSSDVTYASGSSLGTTTTGSQSFKTSNSIGLTAGGGFLADGTVGLSFSFGQSTTDTQSLDIKKSSTTTIKVVGPSIDGVDHDRDQIWLWMNPKVNLQITPNSVDWTLANTGTADIQFVYVGWLKSPPTETMPVGVASALARNGITPADFATILARDPLATSSTAIRTPRYKQLNTTFPYEPPFTATDPPTSWNFNAASSTTNTNGSTMSDTFKIGLTIDAGVDFLGMAKSKIKVDGSWEWTNTSSSSSSLGKNEIASVTVGGPSFGYTGSTDMEVFYDTVYKTFAFHPIGDDRLLGLHGRLVLDIGRPVPHREVTATVGDKLYRTFTDSVGAYRFYAKMEGPVRVQSGRVVHILPEVGPHMNLIIRVP